MSAAATMAWREVRRSPGFATVIAITLGLGITANLTMYSVLDHLLFSPPEHVQDASTLRRVFVHGISQFSREEEYSQAFAFPDVMSLEKAPAFESVAFYSGRSMTIGRGEDSERVPVELASASYFPTLGVKPELGRFYDDREDAIDAADHAAVLSYSLWMRRFAGRRNVIGSALQIGKAEYRIVGVAPRGFTGADISPVDVWLPVRTAGAIEQGTEWKDAFGWYWLGAIARVMEGVTDARASEEATTKFQSARASADATEDAKAKVVLSSIIAGRSPDPSRETMVAKMLGVVALLVLLMTCANAGNLFLARGVQRRRALAVQTAIGVSRGGLVWQLFGEAVLIAMSAGVFAFLLLRVTAPVLFRILLPEATPPHPGSLRVAAVTFAFALATASLAGLLTAFRSSQVAPFEALRAGRSSQRTSRLRRSLLGLQAAFAVVLLLGAGLFLRSLKHAAATDFGVSLDTEAMDFELTNGVGLFDRELEGVVYTAAERLRGMPGVESVAVTSLPPFSGSWGITVDLPGADSIVSGPTGPFYFSAGADYFHTLGMRIVRGRALEESDDRSNVRVAVVNEAMARAVWPGRDAVGQCLIVKQPKRTIPCTTVVGVVNDYRASLEATKARQMFYLPPRHPDVRSAGASYLLIRMKPGTHTSEADLAAAARASSPGIRLVQVHALRTLIAPQIRSWQLGAALLTMFGILALVVAGAGMYSVVAFEVSQRRFELGVRSALGATASRMVGALLSDVLRTTTLGVLCGLLASLVFGRFAQALLFGVKPTDTSVYAAVVAVLIAVGALSVALPAWRVTRIDARTALAEE
jgi:predicted permease